MSVIKLPYVTRDNLVLKRRTNFLRYYYIYEDLRTVNGETSYPIGTRQSHIDEQFYLAKSALHLDWHCNNSIMLKAIKNFKAHHSIFGDLKDFLTDLGYYANL